MLAASDRYVILKDGPTVPVEPLQLLLDMEARGFMLSREGDTLIVRPYQPLTTEDRRQIKRWKLHLLTLMAYEAPDVS